MTNDNEKTAGTAAVIHSAEIVINDTPQLVVVGDKILLNTGVIDEVVEIHKRYGEYCFKCKTSDYEVIEDFIERVIPNIGNKAQSDEQVSSSADDFSKNLLREMVSRTSERKNSERIANAKRQYLDMDKLPTSTVEFADKEVITKDGKIKDHMANIPQYALRATAEAMSDPKYGRHNYSKKCNNLEIIEAGLRHINDWIRGIDLDKDSGKHHLSHAVSNLLIALDNEIIGSAIEGRNPAYLDYVKNSNAKPQ